MNKTLKQGDIIVFKAEDSWLSRAISWFTKTDASHAAMVYSSDSIAELGARGLGVSRVEISDGEDVYVMRLKSEPDSAPLISCADAYLEAGVRYDFPALFLLAGLLIYQRIVPDTKLFHVVDRILGVAALKLDEMIQHKLLHHDDSSMICSQFVYQVFYDCGSDYMIEIVNGCVFNKQTQKELSSSVRLIDLLPRDTLHTAYDPDSSADILTEISPEVSLKDAFTHDGTEALAKELYTELCRSSEAAQGRLSSSGEDSACNLSPAVSLAGKFLSGLKYLLDLVDSDMPLPALFVTPGDLVYHAKNLKKVKMLGLKRIHSEK